MIIKRATTKIDAVYDDKDKAEKETKKQANIKEENESGQDEDRKRN
jgi:hypothetical protein